MIDVTINQEQWQRINQILTTAPGRVRQVYRRAMRRAQTTGTKTATKEVKKRYAITTGNLRTYQTVKKIGPSTTGGGDVVGAINFSGQKIPLYRFSPRPKERKYTSKYVNGVSGWRMTGRVSAADVKGQYVSRPQAFIAQMPNAGGGHMGIFRRAGGTTRNGKEKLVEYWGFSLADMLDYEPAREQIEDDMADMMEKRVEHELLRLLDGG